MCAKWMGGFDAQLVLDGIEKLRTQGGLRLEATQHFVSLGSIVEFNPDIPQAERPGIISNAIFGALAESKLDAKTVLNKITRMESAYIARPKSPFVMLTSLSLPYSKELRQTKLLEATIRFSPQIPHGFKRSGKVLTQTRTAFQEDMPQGFSVVRVEVEARGPHEAANKAFEALDLLRAMWNFALNSRKFDQSVNMQLEPINDIITGPVHSLHDVKGNHLDDQYWYQPDFPRRHFRKIIDVNEVKRIEKEIRRLRQRHSYRHEVDRALRRYCNALDYADLHMSFVKLWGLLEYLTASERIDDIAKRVAFLYADNELVRQNLKYLRGQRNSSVHQGVESGEIARLVFQLMHLVEHVITFHLKNRLNFRSMKAAAEEFLTLTPSTDQLKRQIQVRRYALRLLDPRP